MTNAPQSPPPGWYPDPSQPGMVRWWDGTGWTDQVRLAPDSVRGSGLRSISDWLSETFRAVIDNIAGVFTLIVVILLPAALIGAVTIWYGARDLVLIFSEEPGTTPVTVEGLDSVWLVGIGLLVNVVLSIVFAIAATRLVLAGSAGNDPHWGAAASSGLVRFVPVLLWWIVVWLALLLVFVAAAVIGGLVGPVVGALAFFAALVVLFVFSGRIALGFTVPMIAARGSRDPATALRLTRGHTAGMLGRFLLLAAVSVAANFAGSIITAPIAAMSGGTNPTPGDTTLRIADILGGNLGLWLLNNVVGVIGSAAGILLWHVGMGFLYRDLDGTLDPDLTPTP